MNNMKQVDVVFSESLNSIIGPVQTIKRLIKNHDYFIEHGFDITVFSADSIKEPIFVRAKKSSSSFVRKLKEFARYLALHTKIYGAFRIYSDFKYSHIILNYYINKNRRPDIIVFHSAYDCYVYLKKYRIEGVKVSLFTHSDGSVFDMTISYFPKLKGTFVERKLNRIAEYLMSEIDTLTCIAKIEERRFLEKYPQLKGKTRLVVNGIDDFTDDEKIIHENIKNKGGEQKKYRIITTGSINGRKGQRILVEALAKLSEEKRKEISITIVGDGPERITLENYVETNHLNDYISFTGGVKNTDVYKYLAQANIFVLMSAMEGLPISLIEATRSGLGIIATNVSGIPEISVPGSNGVLINRSVDELVDVLNNLDKYDWGVMGAKSRDLFEQQYCFTRTRKDYLGMIQKTANE